MSDEQGLRWLVEEREKWKQRAEWAEAELVRRDLDIEVGLKGATERRLGGEAIQMAQVPRESLLLATATVSEADARMASEHEVVREFERGLGRAIIQEGLASIARLPQANEVQARAWVVRPVEAVLRLHELGRWFGRR